MISYTWECTYQVTSIKDIHAFVHIHEFYYKVHSRIHAYSSLIWTANLLAKPGNYATQSGTVWVQGMLVELIQRFLFYNHSPNVLAVSRSLCIFALFQKRDSTKFGLCKKGILYKLSWKKTHRVNKTKTCIMHIQTDTLTLFLMLWQIKCLFALDKFL